MKIGIVGGTGDIGEGIALRFSPVFDVIVGSREKDKAETTCRLGAGDRPARLPGFPTRRRSMVQMLSSSQSRSSTLP